MVEDITLKLFILDSDNGEDIKFGMESISERLNYKLKVNLCEEDKLSNFPKDYDGYFVHLSQTSEKALISLREKQPWCKIFITSGAIFNKDLVKFADKLYYTINPNDGENMLKEMHSIYEKK
ncbi:MAG: hypothetical protein PHF86_12385 [Candidatus Nanoarchaeia archaeon]|nr:hypothetical protein [Candidatus Nanoarchaeia archaeon]